MQVFCTRCGTAKEIEPQAASAVLTCAQCGSQFSVNPTFGGPAPAKKGTSAGTVLLIIGAVLALPCFIGILGAIAIPNFIRFQARSKQSESKTNLKSLYAAERNHFAERDTYSSVLSQVGFSPERRNRYAYFASLQGPMEMRSGPDVVSSAKDTAVGAELTGHPEDFGPDVEDLQAALPGVALGVQGTCPDCQFVAACAGNLDGDETLDVWTISTQERRIKGERVPAGVPFNHVNDVTE